MTATIGNQARDRQRALTWIGNQIAAGQPPATAEVQERFRVSERTARNWIRSLDRNGNRTDRQPEAPPTGKRQPASNGSGTASEPGPAAGKTRQQRQPLDPDRQPWHGRLPMAVTGIGIAAVVAAPTAISARSLAGWGRDQLGLAGGWEWLVPVPLDGAALACVGLALYATQRGEAPGFARILVWVLAGCSAGANYRHGATVSPDAAVYFALMPLLAALMLDLALRRVRHTALGGLGALERPLARFRMARWLVAPIETWRAWRTAVREGITDPDEALDRARTARVCHSVPASPDHRDAGDSAVTRHSSGSS